jgi:hypothetical protein
VAGPLQEDAQDLTQAFFDRLIEKDYVQAADPLRGRFRSFLLASFRNFLANEYDRRQAQKRGGGWRPVVIDGEAAERHYAMAAADRLTPETLYERQWAGGVLARVRAALRAECAAAGRADAFDRLEGLLAGNALCRRRARAGHDRGRGQGARASPAAALSGAARAGGRRHRVRGRRDRR